MSVATEVQQWRRELHQRPELGFDETWTAGYVASKLRNLGLEVHEGVGGTGVVGILPARSSDAKAIGLRAELDALGIEEASEFAHKSINPGRMHACGHDGHMAMLLGAAAAMTRARPDNVRIYFIFQPAEEHGRGAQAMLSDGLLSRFPMDAVFALHNWPSLKAGTLALRAGAMLASEDNFKITLLGKGGHASTPHLCRDPLPAMAQIVLAMQTVISRDCSPHESAVLSVTGIVTDGARNAIPGRVEITGDCRTYSSTVSQAIFSRVEAIAKGITQANGCEATLDVTHDFVTLQNDAGAVQLARSAAIAVAGSAGIEELQHPATVSDDFAQLLQHVPGAYVLIGNGGEGTHACGLHNSRYDFNDEALAPGGDFWVALVNAFARDQL